MFGKEAAEPDELSRRVIHGTQACHTGHGRSKWIPVGGWIRRDPGATEAWCNVTDVTLNGIERLRNAFRELVEAEGLRPLAARTGIPVGQIRSLLDGRAVRVTTIQSMTEVLGVPLMIGPGTGDLASAPPYPGHAAAAGRMPEPGSASAVFPEKYGAAVAAPLSDGVAIVKGMADRLATAAQSLLQVVAGWEPPPDAAAGTGRTAPAGDRLVMIPFASGIRGGDPRAPVFQESPELAVGVAREALPSWAQPDRLVCMRAADDLMDVTVREGDVVAFDPGCTEPVDQALFALAAGSGPVVRRLSRRDCWTVVADNPAHPARPLSAEDDVLGRVAWHWPRDPADAGG